MDWRWWFWMSVIVGHFDTRNEFYIYTQKFESKHGITLRTANRTMNSPLEKSSLTNKRNV